MMNDVVYVLIMLGLMSVFKGVILILDKFSK
jgi:hypothetical protein